MSDLSLRTRPARTLNRYWRILMTGCCFTLFGLGGLLLSLVWFNLLLLMRNPQQRRRVARRSISRCFRLFLRCCRTVGVFDYRIEGAELLLQDRRCLIVANHPSLVDYVFLASVMPEADCLVKAGLQKNPFLCGVIRAADYLVNSQGETLLPDSQRRLDQGDAIILFPEGTRTRYGEALKLQRGAANIAVRCRCDLRLVHIVCSQRTLDKQSRWYQVPAEKPLFTISVRQRVDVRTFLAGEGEPESLAARRITHYLQDALTPEHQ